MIAFFISAHGFGHASRASAVMAALRQRDPACRLENVFELIARDNKKPAFPDDSHLAAEIILTTATKRKK